MRWLVSCAVCCDRFCAYDPHGLYQRVDCLAREHLVKRKSCLTPLYASPPPHDGVGDDDIIVVSALLYEYESLKRVSCAITPALLPLVRDYLKCSRPDRSRDVTEPAEICIRRIRMLCFKSVGLGRGFAMRTQLVPMGSYRVARSPSG